MREDDPKAREDDDRDREEQREPAEVSGGALDDLVPRDDDGGLPYEASERVNVRVSEEVPRLGGWAGLLAWRSVGMISPTITSSRSSRPLRRNRICLPALPTEPVLGVESMPIASERVAKRSGK